MATITTDSKAIPQLTGLRAVAAGMVLLLHLDQNYGNTISHWLAPVDQGHLGVDIFFVLSGFILAHVYGGTDAVSSVRGYLRFIWRRLSRLYPIHLATLLALFLMVAGRGLLETNFWRLDELPLHLLMLHAWADDVSWNVPAWSISAEWAAYTLFPFAVALVLRPASLILPATVVIADLAVFQIVVVDHGVARSFLGWPAAARIGAEFLLGVLAFRLVERLPRGWGWDVAALVSFVSALLLRSIPLVQVLLFAATIGALSRAGGAVRTIFAARPMVYLGEISYGVYMVHFPIIKVIQNVNAWLGLERPEAWIAHLLVLFWAIFVVAAAALAYKFIERPARRWCRDRESFLFGRPRAA